MAINHQEHVKPDYSYQIVVKGALSEYYAKYLDGMKMELRVSEDREKNTVIHCKVKDQSALLGILNQLYNLRCFIYSVELM